jgi:hypothetical protein
MRIRLHIYDDSQGNKEEAISSPPVAYIPRVGEYLKLSPESPWYKIQLVVHNLYPGETVDIEAEVYAERVERTEALETAGYKGKF